MPACANPLFLKWVKGTRLDAALLLHFTLGYLLTQCSMRRKTTRNAGARLSATGYENAIRGIQACTTKFEHQNELKGVPGVGPTSNA
ncbi:hypothetical protein F5146DRAFT_272669 [Armillaria mellea]|nr:hypothetical protein F5146DRAFT_272669 [Armillaria mellea]